MEFTICKKLTFKKRKAAKKFLRKKSLQYKQRTYYCKYCGWYHNTSIDSYARREIKELNNKGE